MEYTKGEWVADIRVGVVAVHLKDNEKFNCLDGMRKQCIYWASGKYVDDEVGDGHWTVTDEDKANAQLIASAPDMYEALKELTKYTEGSIMRTIPEQKAIVIKAYKALAKAEGNDVSI